MRKSWYIVGLGLALAAGGTAPRPADHPGLGVELVRADYGAPLAFWAARGRWSASGAEVRLALPGGAVARWHVAFPLDRRLTDAQLRLLSGPRGVRPDNPAARRLSQLPVVAPPTPREPVALTARLLSLSRGRAHVSWVPVYAADADFAWRGGRHWDFLRGLALGRRDPPLARSWVRLAPHATVRVLSEGTPVVLLSWRAAGATTLRGVAARPVDAIEEGPPAA